MQNPPGFEEEFEPYPDIPGTVVWRPKWTEQEAREITQGAETLEQNISAMRALREHLGVTQEELAALLGVTQSAVSKIESKAEPRLSALQKLVEHKGGRLKLVIELNGRETELPLRAVG